MEENTIQSTRYNVLDVREIFENGHRTIILICKEYGKAKRRRIEVGPWKKSVYDDARMLAPGDIILVHDSICGYVHTVEEIEY